MDESSADAAPLVYLASRSPRRRALLSQVGIRYRSVAAEVDETPRPGELARDYVARLALAKARCGQRALGNEVAQPVLGADTAVVAGERIMGKPRDRDEGLAMLEALSGREHRVLSAVAIVAGPREALRVQESRVWFRSLSPAEREAYWDSGEPADKAGGYAIQGRGALFVRRLHGSYSGVVGLPLYETGELLSAFGVMAP